MIGRTVLLAMTLGGCCTGCRSLALSHGRDYMNRGQRAYDAGNYASARDYFKRAIEIDPGIASRHGSLALAFWKLGDLEDARREGEMSTRQAPDASPGHTNLSLIYFSSNRYQDARREAETALRLSPRDRYAWGALGSACISLRDYATAAKACRTAFALDPTDDIARINYGVALFDRGQESEGIEQWKYVAEHGTKRRASAIARLKRHGIVWPPKASR